MEQPNKSVPETVQDPIARFDYYSNRLKLDYLTACLSREFNPDALQELKSYYGEDVRLAGGMNEAFRWFLGNPDVESVEALPTGEPFIERLTKRLGSGQLFKDYNPRIMDTCVQLEKACQEIIRAYLDAPTLESKVMIMTEFFAVKVTCHDVFIHGRGEQASPQFFKIPFVHIDPDREIDYINQVLESTPDDFRLKNIFSYAMASGIDPVSSLSGVIRSEHRDRSIFIARMKTLLENLDKIEARSFFRWDIYGICNFIEGPVFLRRSKTRRCVSVLAEAWENYEWKPEKTCTQASDHLAREAFSLVFDHSKEIQSGSLEYFADPFNRQVLLKKVQEAKTALETLFKNR